MTVKRRHYDKDRRVNFTVRQTWVDPVTNEMVPAKGALGAVPNHQIVTVPKEGKK